MIKKIISWNSRFNYNKEKLQSVYFFTFHKCASTLFSDYVLKNINHLKHVDYAKEIYQGKISDESLIFEKHNHIYGPIRLTMKKFSKSNLIDIVINPEFVRDKKVIFFVRDPRDIMISAYYSFGFTHGDSPVKSVRKQQNNLKKIIQNMQLEEYILYTVEQEVNYFMEMYNLIQNCDNCTVLKYEDMINNFDYFIRELRKFLDLDNTIVQEIYRQTRPKKNEDIFNHRRSGQVSGFRKKLRKNEIDQLNEKLEEVLNLFKYHL